MSFIPKNALLPPILYKNFKEEEHLDNFRKGNIRINLLDASDCLDEARKDSSEGSAVHKYKGENGTTTSRITSPFPVYYLSMAGPESDREKCGNKFGKYMVTIKDPNEFAIALNNAWNHYPISSGKVSYRKIEYNKGEYSVIPEDMLQPHGISTYQKPRKTYWYEEEYRFIFSCKVEPEMVVEKFLELKINSQNFF
jgi:hypothetical protein